MTAKTDHAAAWHGTIVRRRVEGNVARQRPCISLQVRVWEDAAFVEALFGPSMPRILSAGPRFGLTSRDTDLSIRDRLWTVDERTHSRRQSHPLPKSRGLASLDPSRMLSEFGVPLRCLKEPELKVPIDAVRRLLRRRPRGAASKVRLADGRGAPLVEARPAGSPDPRTADGAARARSVGALQQPPQ
jgi:hypothetical protein